MREKRDKREKGGGVPPLSGGTLVESTRPQINCQGTVALALRLERGICGLAHDFSNRIDTILRRIVLTNLRRSRLGVETFPQRLFPHQAINLSAFAISRKSHSLSG